MSYSVYFKYGSKKYKLPVNPEEIKRSRELNIETYQVLEEGAGFPSLLTVHLKNIALRQSFPVRTSIIWSRALEG